MSFTCVRFLLTIVLVMAPMAALADSYRVDSAKSHVTIIVGKAGALSFAAGHTHEVVGPIGAGTLDINTEDPSRSHVRILIRTADLKVSGKGEPPDDVPQVQQTMDGEKVLDVARYPEIVFDSTSIAVKERRADALDLVVTGRMTIRDVTREVSTPIHAQLTADGVTATGRFSIKQTDYGITPISIGGVVKVKDALAIDFTLEARR